MSVDTVAGVLANPFPGLRPFQHEEADLFFGRDRQSDELVRRLARTRFLAVLGTSGSGKSSLVRAGLLPSLDGGFMAQAGAHWLMAIMRPQDDPIGFLARALVEAGVLAQLDLPEEGGVDVVETMLLRSGLGLVEVARLARLEPHQNLLILVDQFEEIFRFADVATRRGADDEAKAFVKLLLAATEQTAVPVYVVITMRSDFLGDCDRFRGLPEAVTNSPYLTPRMTRDELQEAITGPIGVRGGRIAPPLVQRLLNDVGDDPDQLPILQHALMRSWDHWQHDDPMARPIDLSDLEAIGGMEEALSRHAEEAYGSLTSEREAEIAARLFKCLTEKGSDNREIRRPTPLAQIAAIADAEIDEVVSVIDVFRAPGRSFLMPADGVELGADAAIDISHESLIRQWWRLRNWVDEEAESVVQYRRLAESAELNARGAAGLLTDPELSLMLAWQQRERPNDAWAERYDPALDRALAFLETSGRARDDEQTRRHRARQRKRVMAVVSACAVLILASTLLLLVYANDQRHHALSALRVADTSKTAIANALKTRAEAQAEENALNQKITLRNCIILPSSGEEPRGCPPAPSLLPALAKMKTLSKEISGLQQRAAVLARKADSASALLAAVVAGGGLISAASARTGDLFDISEGAGAFRSSGGNARAMFGETPGHKRATVFKDGGPGYGDWVEWTTKQPVKLRSIGLFARHDARISGADFGGSFDSFRLYAKKGRRWVPLVNYGPSLPYGGGNGTGLAVCLTVPPTTAQRFRAVFVEGGLGGPRVVALDGNAATCNEQYPSFRG